MNTRKSAAIGAVVMTAALLSLTCGKETPQATPSAAGLSEDQKVIYALGAVLGQNLTPLKLDDAQLATLAEGLRDAAKSGTLKAEPQAYQKQIQQLFQAKQLEAAQAEKERGKTFTATAAQEAGAQTLPSGIVYRMLKAGSGPSPKASDVVTVHYQGTFVDGKVFDSSVQRGQPAEFILNGVIPCWAEGVQRMKVGEKAKLVCPSDTAYGDQGRGPQMPGGATLVFEVELLGIKPGPGQARK